MTFYVWDYLGYVRALQTGYAEFETIGRKKFGGVFPTCPKCQARIGPMQWQPPFTVRLTTNKIGDLCTDGQDILVSAKFQLAWAKYELTGLEFHESDVVLNTSSSRSRWPYSVLRFPYCVTRLDRNASGLIERNTVGCETCGVATREKLDRIRIDESTWPRFDAFRPSGLYGVTLVTERVVEAISEAGLTNFHFIHQDDYQEPVVNATI